MQCFGTKQRVFTQKPHEAPKEPAVACKSKKAQAFPLWDHWWAWEHCSLGKDGRLEARTSEECPSSNYMEVAFMDSEFRKC